MLHDETRKLLIEAWNKTHNAKEIAECFSVNTSTVYRLEKQMRETGSVKTMTSQRGRKHALTPEDIQNIDRVVRQEPDITIDEIIDKYLRHITDVKPITARQCIKLLPIIAKYKPELRNDIISALHKANICIYDDSMRPLVCKDIQKALKEIQGL